MRLLPIRYCADVAESTRFYRALGLDLGAQTRPGSWVELPAAAGLLALHQATAGVGDCELAFEADEPLEAVSARLAAAGFGPEPILDESFGRSLRVRDPDGVWVQVNENDRTLYT
ncbi:MAG TPA: VOC family protein [Mycobacteriales bacterium]|nr:VOC family protein [Mycobacteriales bacterium]